MWSRVAQLALRGHIQRRRIAAAASWVFVVRILEGGLCWGILYWCFARVTVSPWLVHVNFAAYGLLNLGLLFRQQRETLTPRLVWLDIIGNLLPMTTAAHWSGGVYSPLLPIFMLKLCGYGLVYGVDIGLQSLAATAVAAVGLAFLGWAGIAPAGNLDEVPALVRQRLTLAVMGLIFSVAVGGSFRFFRILQDREARLAEVAHEKDRLYQESLRHQQHLRRLSRRMIRASERTIRMVARELHDDLGQALTALKMDLGLIDRQLPLDSPIRQHVAEARTQASAVLQSVRHLSQLLRPPVLDDLGLVPAIESYIGRFSERTGVPLRLDLPPPDTRLRPPLEVAVYRVLQEALTNVARHAQAHEVQVELQISNDLVSLRVIDDGCGFDAAAFLDNPPPDHGIGVIGMRERVATYGGRFEIRSQPGAGTQVGLTLPLTEPGEEPVEDYGEDSRFVG